MAAAGKVQSIERAIKIINCFSERTPELKLTEIADMLDLNKSTIHGIINTLKDGGLIDQNEENQKYRLGLNLVHYTAQVLKSLDIRRVAEPVIRQLCDEVNETVHLGVLDGKEIVYIDKMESNHAYCTAIGKSILSDYSNEAIERLLPDVLPQYTKTTKTSKAAILAEIDEVRHTGYALDLEENVEGLKCVGAPIYNHEGHVKYSISVSGPIQRMTDEKTAMIIERVKIAAQEISKKIGYIQ
jgi:DNA-binding IclR family transcriptional regulator